MTLRSILLSLLLTLLVLLLIGVLAWPFLNVNKNIRQLVADELEKSIKGRIELKGASLGFLALHLYGFQYQDENQTFTVKIEAATIDFNLVTLLSSRLNILKSISSVSLHHPEATLILSATDSLSAKSDTTTALGWEAINKLPDELWLHKLNLDAGVIRFDTPQGKPWWSLRNLKGQLHSDHPKTLAGKLQSGPASAGIPAGVILLSLDAQTQTLEVTLQTRIGDVTIPWEEFGIQNSMSVNLDSMNLDLRLWSKGSQNGLEGVIQFLDLSLDNSKVDLFRCDTLSLFVDNWKLTIPPTKAEGLSVNWNFSGQIPDLRTPLLDFTISGHSTDSQKITSLFLDSTAVLPQGNFGLDGRVTGDAQSPRIEVAGSLDHFQTDLGIFSSITFGGLYSDRHFQLKDLSAITPEGSLKCTGDVWADSTKSKYALKVDWVGELPNFVNMVLPAKGNLKCSGDFWADSTGPRYTISAEWDGAIPGLDNSIPGHLSAQVSGGSHEYRLGGVWQSSDSTSVPVAINVSYLPDSTALSAEISLPGDTSLVWLNISDFPKKPNYDFAFNAPIPILEQFYRWYGWEDLRAIRFSGVAKGTLEHATYKLEAVNRATSSKFKFDGSLVTDSTRGLIIANAFSFQQDTGAVMGGRIDANLLNHILTLNDFSFDDAITAHGSVDFSKNEIALSEIAVTNWDVSKLVGIIAPTWSGKVGGQLDGRFEIYGDIKNPMASVNLYASRGYFMQQSGFWAVISAELKDQAFNLTECNIGKDVLNLFKIMGSGKINGSSLDFNLGSQYANSSDILKLFGINPVCLSGALQLSAQLKGSIAQPEMSLTAQIPSGTLYHMPFQSFIASIRMDASTAYIPKLTEFSLIQSSDLAIKGQGQLPFRKTPLHLSFAIEGNILKIPNLIEPGAIPVSTGQGKFNFVLDQVDGSVHVSDATLSLRDGMMRFKDVVDEIQDIQAQMHLEGHKVVIDELSGSIDRQKFNISNYFPDVVDSTTFQHLYFPSVDVDIGVVTMSTEGRGIFAKIPSLMVTGSKGYFKFQGKSAGEKFSVSGPTSSPLFRGIISASGTTLTFPFIPSKGPISKFAAGVLRVLNAGRWDVTVQAERDNRFMREIGGLEGTPLLAEMSGLLTPVDVNLTINAGESSLSILGCADQGTFRFLGNLVSTRGSIDYLDFKFKVDQVTVEFDEHDLLPWVEGRGETVYRDSLGQTRNIYITLYVVDPVTKEKVLRGRWGDFILVIEDDAGSSQEQILAMLGYSPSQITSKVTSISGQIVSNAMLRRWIRPIERELETFLKLDLVSLQPTIAQHLFENQILGTDPGPESQVDWGAYFLRQSQLSVGKYLSDDVFLVYTGTWETGLNAASERHFGFLHRWSIEYRIRPISKRLVINLSYQYDSLEKIEDKQATLRYSILF
ncbi:MAG: hypothetical protein NTW14_06445 [bacterium]|nr:hypothetical protein [bacterium]